MIILRWIRLITGFILLSGSVGIFAIEIAGVFKLRFSLNRMHSAAIGDTLGILLGLSGLMILSGFNFTTLKMALVLVFLWCTSPVSSHLIARMEYQTNKELLDNTSLNELDEIEKELEKEDGQ